MTSLGLTFHSRPTPALCILTSLRCVSYILYPTPPPSSCCLTYGSFFSPLHLSLHIPLLGFFKNNKEEKMRKIVSKRSSNPRLVGPRGCWTLASSHFCQQMQPTVTRRSLILIKFFINITKISRNASYQFFSIILCTKKCIKYLTKTLTSVLSNLTIFDIVYAICIFIYLSFY